MRYTTIALSLLLLAAAPAQAQISVGVNIGINVPFYPRLVPVPGYPVNYDPELNANYFFYNGLYWVFQYDSWYASSSYNGPWMLTQPEYVPMYVLRIPVRYYRQPPVYFNGWSRNDSPRWEQRWGQDWKRHHGDRDHGDREGRLDRDRRESYRSAPAHADRGERARIDQPPAVGREYRSQAYAERHQGPQYEQQPPANGMRANRHDDAGRTEQGSDRVNPGQGRGQRNRDEH